MNAKIGNKLQKEYVDAILKFDDFFYSYLSSGKDYQTLELLNLDVETMSDNDKEVLAEKCDADGVALLFYYDYPTHTVLFCSKGDKFGVEYQTHESGFHA